jgi:hypothetical protein
MNLSALCTIKVNFELADFWLVRRGTLNAVGKPVRSFYREHIGIKVVKTEILLPDYLFYVFLDFNNRGLFKPLAVGTLSLVHIRVQDIKNIQIG